MATCSDHNYRETTEVSSPVPRAPPPSPEYPTRSVDLTQFDFNALLSNNKKSSHTTLASPSGSSHEESEPISPGWNESGSFNSHSPFFLPSPERLHHALSDPSSPSHSSYGISPPRHFANSNPQGNLYESHYHHAPPNGRRGLLSASLPVNGELRDFQYRNPSLPSGHSHFDVVDSGERRRKTSLKRPHEQAEQSWYSSSCNQSWLNHENDFIQKKMCSEVRERESRDFNRSPSPQRTRAYTHTGVSSSRPAVPLSADFGRLTISKEGVVMRRDGCFTNHLQGDASFSGAPPISYQSHLGSHVIPQMTQTVGFVTEDVGPTPATHEDAMEMGETGTTHGNTRISITRADSIDHNSMDCSQIAGHAPHDHTPFGTKSSFSLTLGSSSNFNPSHLHPFIYSGSVNGGVMSNDVLSHSL